MRSVCDTQVMAPGEIDRYLAALDEPERSTLAAVRGSILEVVPGAEECISYGAPAFKVEGKAVAGFAAYKDHLSYLPHSASVLAVLGDDIAAYDASKGALKFAIDTPLPKGSGEEARRHSDARARLGMSDAPQPPTATGRPRATFQRLRKEVARVRGAGGGRVADRVVREPHAQRMRADREPQRRLHLHRLAVEPDRDRGAGIDDELFARPDLEPLVPVGPDRSPARRGSVGWRRRPGAPTR